MNIEETKIEYLGPKRLVIVRVPYFYYEEDNNQFLNDFKSLINENALKDYQFITICDPTVERVEFEYPKNDCWWYSPSAILSTKSMSEAEREGLLKAFNTK